MKTENKIKLLIWSTIVLALINLSILGIIFFRISIKHTQIVNNEDFSGIYFRERLHLTDDQLLEFKEFNPHYRELMRDINRNLQMQRLELFNEMTNSNNSKEQILLIADSIGKLHKALKILTVDYYNKIYTLCEPSQKDSLKLLFREIMSKETFNSQNGRHQGVSKKWNRGKRDY